MANSWYVHVPIFWRTFWVRKKQGKAWWTCLKSVLSPKAQPMLNQFQVVMFQGVHVYLISRRHCCIRCLLPGVATLSSSAWCDLSLGRACPCLSNSKERQDNHENGGSGTPVSENMASWFQACLSPFILLVLLTLGSRFGSKYWIFWVIFPQNGTAVQSVLNKA